MSSYNFDSTALSADNRIPAEAHTVNTVAPGYNNYFVPDAAPFYRAGLVVIDKSTGMPLNEITDYVLTHKYTDANQNINLEVFGSITLVDQARVGTFILSYQTLGGSFVTSVTSAIRDGLNILSELNAVDWSEIAPVPTVFPSTPHNHPVTEFEAVTELLNEFKLIREAIANPQTELTLSDIVDLDDRFVQPLTSGLTAIANAIIERSGTTNIPFEISTPGRTKTELGPMNNGSWKMTPLVVTPSAQGSYKIDFDINTNVLGAAPGFQIEKRWVVNGVAIDRSFANHTVVGLATSDVVGIEIRIVGSSATNVVIADNGFTSSLTITRLGI